MQHSQAIFRCVLEAMARPGVSREIPVMPYAPAPLNAASTAVALTLFDDSTPVWLDAAADSDTVREFLAFHCGCPIVRAPEEASFAIIVDAAAAPRLSAFSIGDDSFPDRSATVVFQVTSLTAGQTVVATGPGIQNSRRLSIDGLPAWFWEDWTANHAAYPLGIDLLLASGSDVVGMPRSIRVVNEPCT